MRWVWPGSRAEASLAWAAELAEQVTASENERSQHPALLPCFHPHCPVHSLDAAVPDRCLFVQAASCQVEDDTVAVVAVSDERQSSAGSSALECWRPPPFMLQWPAGSSQAMPHGCVLCFRTKWVIKTFVLTIVLNIVQKFYILQK